MWNWRKNCKKRLKCINFWFAHENLKIWHKFRTILHGRTTVWLWLLETLPISRRYAGSASKRRWCGDTRPRKICLCLRKVIVVKCKTATKKKYFLLNFYCFCIIFFLFFYILANFFQQKCFDCIFVLQTFRPSKCLQHHQQRLCKNLWRKFVALNIWCFIVDCLFGPNFGYCFGREWWVITYFYFL